MFFQRKKGSNALLIVILQKVRARGNESCRRGQKMFFNTPWIATNQLIIKFLVVSVVESQRLQPAFQSPIGLREKQEFGLPAFHRSNGLAPKFQAGASFGWRTGIRQGREASPGLR